MTSIAVASRVLITTVPFGEEDPLPLRLLEEAGVEYAISPAGRKLTEGQLAEMIPGVDILIAGTEPITDRVMEKADRLKLISRVGTGVDSVDLLAARRRGIAVSHTIDAPGPAVVELTIGLMLALLRQSFVSSSQMHRGEWQRWSGRRIPFVTFGIIGAGRIGGGVIRALAALGARRILANDIRPDPRLDQFDGLEWVDKDVIYREADVVSMHVPMTQLTRGMIGAAELAAMKPDAMLLNTARGGIIDETALCAAMERGHLSGAAIDVFEQEPYAGPLAAIERCILTAHMGSMSADCRARMEREATEEAVRFAKGQRLQGPVPELEYEVQRQLA